MIFHDNFFGDSTLLVESLVKELQFWKRSCWPSVPVASLRFSGATMVGETNAVSESPDVSQRMLVLPVSYIRFYVGFYLKEKYF